MIVRAKIVETAKGDIALRKNQGATFNSIGTHLIDYFSQPMPDYDLRDSIVSYPDGTFWKEKRRGFIEVPEIYGYIYDPKIGPRGYSWKYHNALGNAYEGENGLNWFRCVPPHHWLNDGDKWKLLGGEVEYRPNGIATGMDPLFYEEWSRDKATYSETIKTQDYIHWSSDGSSNVQLLMKHGCIIYNDRCLALNAPVMFGFHFRNTREQSGTVGMESAGSHLLEIKIRTLGRWLPSSYSSSISTRDMDDWKHYEEAEYLYIKMYTDKVVVSKGSEHWVGLHVDRIRYENKIKVASFNSRLNRTKPDGYWCEYCYFGLIPLGNCILLMYNVNGVVTYHPIRWTRTLPFKSSAFNTEDGPEDGVSWYDEEKKDFVDPFIAGYHNDYSRNENIETQCKNPVVWEHLAGVMLTVKDGICPVDVVISPMLFNMYPLGENKYPRLSTNVSLLGYKPDFCSVGIEDDSYPNPEIELSACLPDYSTEVYAFHLYDYEDDADEGKTLDNTYKSQVSIASKSYYSEDPYRDFKFMESKDTDLGLKEDTTVRFATVTPLIKMIRRTYHPENMKQSIIDTVRVLETDIVNIERSNSAESSKNFIAIEKLRITIVCYDKAHTFLRAGKHIRIEVFIDDNSYALGHFIIRKVTRSRIEYNEVQVVLDCQSILSQIDKTPILNCEVYDGYDPRMAIEKLLKLADLNYITKTESDPTDATKKYIDSRFSNIEVPLSEEDLIQLPYSTSSHGANFRPRFGTMVRRHIEKIMTYTGHKVDIDFNGVVWFYPELRSEEQTIQAYFVDEFEDTARIMEKYGYGVVTYDEAGRPFVNTPEAEQLVRMIPFSSLEEIEPDELATRVLVLGPNLNLNHYTRPHTGKRNMTSVPLPKALSGLNMALMTNTELEKELGEVRYSIYTDRNLVSGQTVSDLAEYLFRLLGKRRQFYQLEIPDLSYYPDLTLYSRVKMFSRTADMWDYADGMDTDVYGNQISSIPCQVYPFQDFMVLGYSVNFTKTSVGGTVYLVPYLPMFEESERLKYESSSVFEGDVNTSPPSGLRI